MSTSPNARNATGAANRRVREMPASAGSSTGSFGERDGDGDVTALTLFPPLAPGRF